MYDSYGSNDVSIVFNDTEPHILNSFNKAYQKALTKIN